MTTIISWKIKDTVFIAGDTQISKGYNKPLYAYQKIERVGDCLVGGAGSVGYLQRMSSLAIKKIRIERAMSDSQKEISPFELSETLAELNFELPLEHKHFNPYEFIVCGFENNEPVIYSIGDDGSLINIPNIEVSGSGGIIAQSFLTPYINKELPNSEIASLLFEAIKTSSLSDVYTNNQAQVFCMTMEKGKIKVIEWEQPLANSSKNTKEGKGE